VTGRPSTPREDLLLLALPAAGALLVACALAPYGPALDQVGLHSLAAASSLLGGDVVRTSRGEAFTIWPPLLPALLAAFKTWGVPYTRTAGVLNVASLFLLLVSTGHLVRAVGRSLWAALLAQAAVLTSPIVFKAMLTVKTEPLFLALVVSGALCAVRYRESGRAQWLRLGALALALACLQRYVGMVFVATTAAWLCLSTSGRGRWRAALTSAVFAVAALAPVLLWMLRNVLQGDAASGARDASAVSAATNARVALTTCSWWLASGQWPAPARAAVLGGFLLLAGGGAVVAARGRPAAGSPYLFLCALPVVYAASLIAYASRTHLDALGNRLMLPAYPFVFALLAAGAAELQRRWGARSRAAGRAVAMLALVVVGATGRDRVAGTWNVIVKSRSQGVGGLTSKEWAESNLAKWLSERRFEGPVYSNLPELVFYFSGSHAAFLPAKRQRAFLRESELARVPGHIVWVTRDGKPELRADEVLVLEQEAGFWNGAVYRTRPRP